MVAAHLDFYNEVKPDLLKIMSDIVWPIAGLDRIAYAADWARLRPTPANHPVFDQWLADVSAVVAGLAGKVPTVLTMFNPFCMANDYRGDVALPPDLACNRIMADLTDDRHATLHGFSMITETLMGLMPRLKATGVDGIFFASIGGERARFSRDAFDRAIAPFDSELLREAQSATGFTILHVCGSAVDLERYAGMPFDIANWDHAADNPVMLAGAQILQRDVMGGVDPVGMLAQGKIDSALQNFYHATPHGVVIGAPGCAIASPAPDAALAEFVVRHRRFGGVAPRSVILPTPQ
jgi:uroporphyrinogen decarboxylase